MPSSNAVLRCPPESANPEAKATFYREFFNSRAIGRVSELARMVRNIHYTYGRQWITLDRDRLGESSRGFYFKSQSAPKGVPMTTTNIILPAVDVEVSSLTKRQWTGKVISTAKDPRVEAAARENDKVLEYRLKQNDWPDTRDNMTWTFIMTGFGALVTYNDEEYLKPTWIVSPDLEECTACGTVVSSREIDYEMSRKHDVPASPIDGKLGMRLNRCPKCASQPMVTDDGEIEPSDTLAPPQFAPPKGTADFFGRPTWIEAPFANPVIEEVLPWHFYPDNSGMVEGELRAFGIRKVLHIDEVERRFPSLTDKLTPLSQAELLDEHPLLGDWDYLGRFEERYDTNVYSAHVFLDYYCEQPSMRFKNGRFLAFVKHGGGVAVQDLGDLIVERPLTGELLTAYPSDEAEKMTWRIQRMKVHYGNWMKKRGSVWGLGAVDNMIHIQDRINAMDSQVSEARERTGSPGLLLPEGAELRGPEWIEGYGSGKVMHWNPSPTNPTATPEPFGSTLFPSGVWPEYDRAIQNATKLVGPQEVDMGQAPRNISTTSGLQVLGENAERRRAPHERPLIKMAESAWTHLLQLEAFYRTEPEEFEYETSEGSWDRKMYKREDIVPGVSVRIEKQAYIDRSLWTREAAREAQADQLYDVSSPLARKKLLELRGLPTNVNDDTNRQVDLAKRQWVAFVDEAKVPIINSTLDNPMLHFLALQDQLLSDEGQNLLDVMEWNSAFQKLAGWERGLTQLQALVAMQDELYPPGMDEAARAEAYARLVVQWDAQDEEYKALAAKRAMMPPEAQASVPPLPPPPPRPVEPVELPHALELQVYAVWKKLLPPDIYADPKGDTFLKFMAAVEAYRILATPAPPAVTPEVQSHTLQGAPPPPPAGGAAPTEPLPLGGAQGG